MQRLITTVLFYIALSLQLFAADSFAEFDVPGALLTRPFGVNARGQIVGLYRDATGNHGFLKDGDTYTTIQVPGAIFTNATGINARGNIVGRWTDTAGYNHAYLRTHDGQFTFFDPAAPCVITRSATVAHGINDVGDIVGRCFDSNKVEHGFLLRDGALTILDFPGSLTTDAWMVNNSGEIVGDYTDATGLVHGYLRTADGQFTSVDFPLVPISSARSINERGEMTGVYRGSANPNPQTLRGDQGFLLSGQEFLTIALPPHGIAMGNLAISNNGVLVGDYLDDTGGEHGFFIRFRD